jgi:hypothetical protein
MSRLFPQAAASSVVPGGGLLLDRQLSLARPTSVEQVSAPKPTRQFEMNGFDLELFQSAMRCTPKGLVFGA